MTVAAERSATFSTRALRADRRVLRTAHPVAYPVVRALDRLGPAARVPGLGVVVNDPDLVREVLVDADTFRKDGPGSPGALWTPVVGRRALTNLDGAEHRDLRTALAGLFTPEAAAAAVAEAAGGLADLTRRLAAGEEVDVAAVVRTLVGTVVGRLLGAGFDGEEALAVVRAGERLTASVRLHTRALSPAVVARARQVLAAVTEPAAAAWRAGDAGTVPGRMRGLGLSEQDARSVAGVLFLTGTETVTSLLPRLVALLADSGLLTPDTVGGTLAGLDRLVAEALRATVPTPVTLRRADAAARVGPVSVRAGERLLVLTVNACWSRRPAPRDTGELRQLWFGAGPHFCLGRPLALAEASALVTAVAAPVADRGEPLRVVHRRARRRVLIPAWQELRVRLG